MAEIKDALVRTTKHFISGRLRKLEWERPDLYVVSTKTYVFFCLVRYKAPV